MIKIELVKFEAQDVITASVEKPTSVPTTSLTPATQTKCTCPWWEDHRHNGVWYHGFCKYEGKHNCHS